MLIGLIQTWSLTTNEVLYYFPVAMIWIVSVKVTSFCESYKQIKLLLMKSSNGRNIHCMPAHSVMSDSLPSFGLQPTRFLCPWDFSGKNGMELVAISSSRGCSQSRDQTRVSCVSCITNTFFTSWTVREAPHIIWTSAI